MGIPFAAQVQNRRYLTESPIGGMLTTPLPSVSADQPATPGPRPSARGGGTTPSGAPMGFSPTFSTSGGGTFSPSLSRRAALRLGPQANAMVGSFGASQVEGEELPAEYWRGAYSTEEARVNDELKQDIAKARETAIARGEEGSSTYQETLRNLTSGANRRLTETRRGLLQSRSEAIREDRWRREQLAADAAKQRRAAFYGGGSLAGGGSRGKKGAGGGPAGEGDVDNVIGGGGGKKPPWAGPQPGDPKDPNRAPTEGPTLDMVIEDLGKRGKLSGA